MPDREPDGQEGWQTVGLQAKRAVLSDQAKPHREFECPVDGCPVCMPPLGVVISMEDKAEFDRLQAENEALREELGRRDDVIYTAGRALKAGGVTRAQQIIAEYEDRLYETALASTTKEGSDG